MRQDGNSQQQLHEEINDKLNQLWSGMKNKRKEILRNLTPNYSKRTDQSQVNQSLSNYQVDSQIVKLRQKLSNEVSERKKKEIQIESLKKTIIQLTNDKKMLILELEQLQSQSQILNQSSIHSGHVKKIDGKTANFSTYKKNPNLKNIHTIQEEPQQTHYNLSENEKVDQNMSKQRLLDLLRSTAQYRQFVFYYDSFQLSYLKRLQQQHKKHCDHSKSQKEKQFWAPNQIISELKMYNHQQKLGLTDTQIQFIISKMKYFYERNMDQKMKKIKQMFQSKTRKMQRENQYGVPYDIVQICRAKQRQLSKNTRKTRNNTIIK